MFINSQIKKEKKNAFLNLFRKNVIPQSECKNAFNALYEQSQKLNSNRGSAAGLLKKNRLPAY